MSVASIVWLVLIVVFGIIEAFTVNFVSIWFALGAIAALIASALTGSVTVQCTLFVIISALALVLSRPLKKRLTKAHIATNADSNIGRTATIIVAATAQSPARAHLDGVDWNVRSQNQLCVGDKCNITAIEGNTLIVETITAKV